MRKVPGLFGGAMHSFCTSAGREWHSCRESFHNSIMKSKKSREFFFVVTNHEQVAAFIAKIEDKINLPFLERAKFEQTDENNCVYVIPNWWSVQPLRLSFLTALLRCGTRYNGENFITALYSREYTSETKPAVERFLDGHTWHTGRGGQWHATFNVYNNKRPDHAERLLIKDPTQSIKPPSDRARAQARRIVDAAFNDAGRLEVLIAQLIDDNTKSVIARPEMVA